MMNRMELPPRARRIRSPAAVRAPRWGTTSACTENTAPWPVRLCVPRNYLRVRGEYKIISIGDRIYMELPPRARRIRDYHGHRLEEPGTTSACAENTAAPHSGLTHLWNYLRVRGEYLTG